MGWSYGINSEGREVGYSVQATCDHPGCETQIDRGLAYVCGGMHDGGDYGCGRYFCGEHMYWSPRRGERCARCNRLTKAEQAAIARMRVRSAGDLLITAGVEEE